MIYDAFPIVAAKKLKAKIILTLNLKHYQSIWPEGKKIIKSP